MKISHNDSQKVRLQFKPGVIVLVVLLLGFAVMVTPLYDAFAKTMTVLPERTEPAWVFAAAFMLVYLCGLVAHEAGHVAAAAAVGGRLEQVMIGLAPGVALFVPDGRTNAHQARISFGGPAAQILYAVGAIALGWPLMALSAAVPVAAVLVLVEGLANLLLPVTRNSDAAKLFRSLWRCARGRAGEPFVTGPAGAGPAPDLSPPFPNPAKGTDDMGYLTVPHG